MSDKYWIEYLKRKSPLNYDEYLENRIAELEAENQRLRGAIELCERCRPYAHGAGTCKKSLDDMMALLGGGENGHR